MASSTWTSGIFQHFSKHGLHDKALINGAWVNTRSNKTFDVTNPATDEVIASVPDMDDTDTEVAIQAAHSAFQLWQDTTAKERSKLLRAWYDLLISKQKEMAEVLTLENGKPLKEALGEIIYSADYVELYAEEAKRLHGAILQSPVKSELTFQIRQSLGVLGMFTPKFPAALGPLTMTPSTISPFPSDVTKNMLGSVRCVTYASMQKGKRKTVKTVPRRFYRLYWGAWIRPKAGRHTRLYRKNGSMRTSSLQHVFCKPKQSLLLDKMVCKFWRDRKYYVDDPYESYHVRDNYFATRKYPQ